MSGRARNYPAEARAFIDANPRFWSQLTNAAVSFKRLGRTFSIRDYIGKARIDSNLARTAHPYLISNSWCAAFASFLLAEHPELADTIETRRRTTTAA